MNTRQLTDNNATPSQVVVSDYYKYDAFGAITDSTGSTSNKYIYTGEQHDGELGQYYLRARYYDTASGRFLARDVYPGRIQDPPSLHAYLYGHANPVAHHDPTGNYAIGIAVAVTVAVLGFLLFRGNFQTDEPQRPNRNNLTAHYHSIQIHDSRKSVHQIFERVRHLHVDSDIITHNAAQVHRVGHVITFSFPFSNILPAIGQASFSVQVTKLKNHAGFSGPDNHLMVVQTLDGHPLSGWRFWRVFKIDNGDIVVETGAVISNNGPHNSFKQAAEHFMSGGSLSGARRTWLALVSDARDFSRGTRVANSPYDVIFGTEAPERVEEFLKITEPW